MGPTTIEDLEIKAADSMFSFVTHTVRDHILVVERYIDRNEVYSFSYKIDGQPVTRNGAIALLIDP